MSMRNLIIRWLRLDERYVAKRSPEDLNRILAEIEESVTSTFSASR
ncbi:MULTISPECIES: hypothetical protein [unclassified Aurantimonas]|nr:MULTISPECIES: hypothetical protein [unclassified Aurantimonas]MEC5289368.1 hypothetical protein [Aurantimonas sp. C2-3-R2]MEC5410448.1 hypothetical protein [Aurantimonas sp. C2-4-R8]